MRATKNWRELAEYAFLGFSALGTIAAAATQQTLYAATPLTITLSLNLLNRQELTRRTRQIGNNVTRLEQQVSSNVCSLSSQIQSVEKSLISLANRLDILVEQSNNRPELEEIEKKRRASVRDISRDTTQYSFMGNFYGKGKLILAVITEHIKKHPNMTFQKLKEDFPDQLQGNFGVVALLEDALEIIERTSRKHKRHFIAENEILITSDNQKIAVSTQWGAFNISNFINRARELGYQIEAQ
jgi:hypothetical protein